MYQFEIFAPLKPQKQTRWTKSGHAYDPSKKDKEAIQWQIKPLAPTELICGPVEVTYAFFFAIPKATSKIKRQQMLKRIILPDIRPDDGNLSYLIDNALQGIVYDDDKRIVARHQFKFYGTEEKTVIRVRPILVAENWGYRDADYI